MKTDIADFVAADRPKHDWRSSEPTTFEAAVIATVENGQAVRVAANGHGSAIQMRMAMLSRFKRIAPTLSVRLREKDGHWLLWAEPKPPAKGKKK